MALLIVSQFMAAFFGLLFLPFGGGYLKKDMVTFENSGKYKFNQ